MSRKQGKELSMPKVREILRLGLVCHLSQRQIAQSCHMSQASVSKSKLYTANRVEAASQRAIPIGAFRYSSVHSILKKGLDRHPLS